MTAVRLAAAEILLALDRGRTTLATEVDRRRPQLADARDRALLLELAAGAVRWRAELDALIATASRRSIRAIDSRALAVLRLGVYQIRHLERIPPHAIVHDSVEVVRGLGAPRAAGFVNAVLRTVLRRGRALALPARATSSDPEARQLAYLSIALSHPEWLVKRWLSRYGFDATERWCRFNNTAPDTTVRPVRGMSADELLRALREHQLDAGAAPFVGDAIRLAPGALGHMPAELADYVQIQDEGAQLVARAVGARPSECVLDICASPGGKALVLAADMDLADRQTPARRASGQAAAGTRADGLLVAGDLRETRVAVLADTLARARLSIPLVRHDARLPLPFAPVFDAVVLDAPCSGLGTLRRDPDLKWTRSEADLPVLAEAERRMLDEAAAVVRPGGRLVYATCSSEPDENQAVAGAFLDRHREFALVPVSLPGQAAAGLVDAQGHLVTLPFRDGLDAFFAAVFVRRRSA